VLGRRLAAEALGSLLLAAAVIGSCIMAERLAQGNEAVALIANTGTTVATLAVLIALFQPISGVARVRRALDGRGMDRRRILVHIIHVFWP
jgi:glycerol uptake facilitator-like aquaporin